MLSGASGYSPPLGSCQSLEPARSQRNPFLPEYHWILPFALMRPSTLVALPSACLVGIHNSEKNAQQSNVLLWHAVKFSVNTSYSVYRTMRSTFFRFASSFKGDLMETGECPAPSMVSGHERSVALELAAPALAAVVAESLALEEAVLGYDLSKRPGKLRAW